MFAVFDLCMLLLVVFWLSVIAVVCFSRLAWCVALLSVVFLVFTLKTMMTYDLCMFRLFYLFVFDRACFVCLRLLLLSLICLFVFNRFCFLMIS